MKKITDKGLLQAFIVLLFAFWAYLFLVGNQDLAKIALITLGCAIATYFIAHIWRAKEQAD